MNSFPNSKFPPNGYNNNNFNRQSVPSNNFQFKENHGVFADPNDNFISITSNSKHLMNQNQMSNFKNAYKQPYPIIETMDYKNQNNIIHNNLADNLMNENITEYRVMIDSVDRNIKAYPDPLSFIVKFGVLSGGSVNKNFNNDESAFFEGPPQPYINKDFKNVKYVKLDTIVLPQRINLEKDNDTYSCKNRIADDRFVSLNIESLEHTTMFATADNSLRTNPDTGRMMTTQRPFAVIIPDKLCQNHYLGIPYYGEKIFKSSNLGNITNMNIKFTDSLGFPLKIGNLYTYDELECAKISGHPIPVTDCRHPLNKKYQVFMTFIIGVVECELATNTKYDQ